ncbi:pyridoxamine 5'-phosphate oxidase family protein [Nonomuraea typhae]|uniref:pyridoxamine 5'-phosphate oxidase family protein n=1 Tax=Nonomuraea typhae TaxID=2603600 RepID=UPI0012FA30C2|nr:pyridoxamine 5'-phosphate oxidase family protein [Nonomuraea typhae]
MSDQTPADVTNLDRYGHAPLPWERALAQLTASTGPEISWFLGTVRPDGRPHATGVGAIWYGGAVHFTSGPHARKTHNLEANPNCTFSVRLEGIDLNLEGTAHRVTDAAEVAGVAARYAELGWPASAEGDAITAPYSAPSAGPAPWYVYRFSMRVAFGVATAEPHGATRWRFA